MEQDFLFNVIFRAAKIGMDNQEWNSRDIDELRTVKKLWLAVSPRQGYNWDKYEGLLSRIDDA